MTELAKKVRGVVDIVFLVDVTGSMQPCIDALKNHIGTFIDTLSVKDANHSNPIRDWRARVVGYRDHRDNPDNWLEQHPFVADAAALRAQLSSLTASGGGDEPESLLDALYVVAKWPQSDRGASDVGKWRYRSEATRVVVVFTDASFHAVMTIPEAKGGVLCDDVMNPLIASRVILTVFAPDLACHHELTMLNKSVYECIPVPDGTTPQRALEQFTGSAEGFKKTMAQLAMSVSQSASVPLAD